MEGNTADDRQRDVILEGTILRGREFQPVEGRVVVEDGTITAVEEARTDSDDIVLPAFVNAHTHLGDSIAKEAGGGLGLAELVAPPDGLKHRLLDEASESELVEAMRRSLKYMEAGGTAACIDFRENGVAGVEALQQAAGGLGIEPTILGRETLDAMAVSDGYGASSTNDGEFSRQRAATGEAGKLFGIHAGEADGSDVNGALDLEPDFLVHMVHPRDVHLERIDDSGIPVVVCLRSNLVTDAGVPPVRDLLDRTTVALGTDNVMLNGPSVFREMEFLAKLTDASASEILAMATVNGAEILGADFGVVEPGHEAKLQVLDGDSHNLAGAKEPVRAVVRRAGVDDVRDVIL